MASGINLTGLREVESELAGLGAALRREVVMSAVAEASAVMRDEMALVAPILDKRTANSTALPPRALKEGIRSSVTWLAWGYVRAIIGPRKGTGRAAHLVEFGHRLVKGGESRITYYGIRKPKPGKKQGREIGDVPAHPFLRPAYEATAQKVLDTLAQSIWKHLKEVVDYGG